MAAAVAVTVAVSRGTVPAALTLQTGEPLCRKLQADELADLRFIVTGLRRDCAAARAGLTLPHKRILLAD